jgi:tRNA(fMet)-specific endonuclease VapC
MTYLIDTNILIDHLRGDLKVTRFLNRVESGEIKVFISVITEYEILCGRFTPKVEKEIHNLLSIFPSLNVNSEIAKVAAKFYKKYQLGIADVLIAATAFCFNATLITRNIKHFQRIKEIKTESI